MNENSDDSYMIDIGENRYLILKIGQNYILYCGDKTGSAGNFLASFSSQEEALDYARRHSGHPIANVPLP